MSKKFGYRGYIGSRPVRGTNFPHRVQNLVIRNYADRHGLAYKLSATEYAMSGCYMMLTGVMEELPLLEGVILFSLFMLPQRKQKRLEIYQQILSQGCKLYTALEEMVLQNERDIDDFEEMIEVVATLPNTPMKGYYQKVDKSSEKDSFWQAIDADKLRRT